MDGLYILPSMIKVNDTAKPIYHTTQRCGKDKHRSIYHYSGGTQNSNT